MMNDQKIEALAELEAMAREADLIDKNSFVSNSLQWLAAEWNEQLYQSLYNYLVSQQDSGYFIEDVFVLPKDDDNSDGQLKLGMVLGRNIEFCHSLQRLSVHILVSGTSGSGKTNFSKLLIAELVRNGLA